MNRIEHEYNIDKGLINKSKGFLVNNSNMVDQLCPEEENKIMTKLNEDLRESMNFERSLSVVKSSIFFICRWTKQMQIEMAFKMHKLLLRPNERLLQPAGNERIYIINRGKI